jgi:hypothetical protein
MLANTLLAPAPVLAVGGLINSVQIPGRCEFGQGVVLNPSGPFNSTGPPVNGLPQHVALNAQLTSKANGGLGAVFGITSAYITWRNYTLVNFSSIFGPVLAGFLATTRLGRKYTMVVGALSTSEILFSLTFMKASAHMLNSVFLFRIQPS